MSKYRPKEKLAPFVAIFRHTQKSPAWKASSVGARATFLALKSNYNTKAQNAVFLSARNGAKELGVHKDTARKWLHELEHYGLIALVRGAHLGVHGTGRAALYRLTDCPYAGAAPTYDFQNWDGVLFESKKQNPVRKNRTPRPKKPDIRADAVTPQNGNKCPTEPDIRNAEGCPTEPDITSFTSSLPIPRLVWSAPEVTEVVGAEAAMLLEASKLWKLPPIAQHNQRAENFGLKLLRERAKSLGYRLLKRNGEYQLVHSDGSGIGASDLQGIADTLDVAEGKVAVQYTTACGMFIGDNSEAVARYANTRH